MNSIASTLRFELEDRQLIYFADQTADLAIIQFPPSAHGIGFFQPGYTLSLFGTTYRIQKVRTKLYRHPDETQVPQVGRLQPLAITYTLMALPESA